MRRYVPPVICLLVLALAVGACSDDPAQPERPLAEKRGPIIDDPPPGYDQFFWTQRQFYDDTEWIEIEVNYNGKTGGSVTVVPDAYPSTHEIKITTFGDPVLGKENEKGTLWVMAPPAGGGTVYTPGDCVYYRTQNLPSKGEPAAKIELPIMDWYDTASWDGNFTTYELVTNDQGWPDSANEKSTSMEWPPDPDDVVHVTVEADPDKDNPNSIVDQVLDPQEPGDD